MEHLQTSIRTVEDNIVETICSIVSRRTLSTFPCTGTAKRSFSPLYLLITRSDHDQDFLHFLKDELFVEASVKNCELVVTRSKKKRTS